MNDLTPLFHERIKAVRERINKPRDDAPAPSLRLDVTHGAIGRLQDGHLRLVSRLRTLRRFLKEHWQRCLRPPHSTISFLDSVDVLSDAELDQIDREMKEKLQGVRHELSLLKEEIDSFVWGDHQSREHCVAISKFVLELAKQVEQSHQRLQHLRLQLCLEIRHESYYHRAPPRSLRKRTNRKDKEKKRHSNDNLAVEEHRSEEKIAEVRRRLLAKDDENRPNNEKNGEEQGKGRLKLSIRGGEKVTEDDGRSVPPSLRPQGTVSEDEEKENEGARVEIRLTPEQQQIFERENVELQNRLHSIEDQLREIETQMNTIGQATAVLAITADQQVEQLEHIFALTGEAFGHISRGTKTLKIAKATSSDVRLFTLVLVLFLAFSLLLIHWFY